jgi:hypothetical protein
MNKLSNIRAKKSGVNFQFQPCRNCGLYREVIMQDGRDGPLILTFPDRSLISPDKFTCSNLPPEGWEEAYAKSENVCGGVLNHREEKYNKDKPLFDTANKSESEQEDESARAEAAGAARAAAAAAAGAAAAAAAAAAEAAAAEAARADLLQLPEKNLTSENKYDNKDQIMDILRHAKKDVFSYITSSHGRLLNPSDGENHDILPANMKLFLIVSRGYTQLSRWRYEVSHGKDTEEHVIKFVKALKKGIQSKNSLFGDDGCLTYEGERTLAELSIIMGTGKTYDEYYGVKYGEKIPEDKIPWYAFQLDLPEQGVKWSVPNLMLKEYDREYNDQLFAFSNITEIDRFGIIFMYTDKKDGKTKNIYLSLKPLLYAQDDTRTTEELDSLFKGEGEFSLSIRMSDVFQHIQDFSTDERTHSLKFFFTHASCRVVGDSSDALTKQLSDKKESNTINCFIKKFPEDKRGEITEYFKDAQDAGMTTMFEFYNMLKDELKIYDIWLEALRKGGQGGDELFKIINFLGNLSVDVPFTEIRGLLERAMVGGARKKKKHTKKKKKSKKRKKYKSKRKTKRR